MSSAQLSQILGHARADTFLKHYNSSKVRVDVQASFLGTPSKAALFKKVGQLRLRRSPDLPRALDPAEVEGIKASEEVRKLQEQREQLRTTPCSTDNESIAKRKKDCQRLTRQINSAITSAKRKALQQKVYDFHRKADENAIADQLLGNLPSSTPTWLPVQHQLAERRRLCVTLFQHYEASNDRSALEDLIDLCPRYENARVKGSTAELPSAPDMASQEITDVDDSLENVDTRGAGELLVNTSGTECQERPTIDARVKRWTSLTCIFCYGNPACGSAEPYKNSASLRRHLRHIHFVPLANTNGFPLTCPFPQCLTLLTDTAHIANHVCTAHGTDLGSRSCFGC